MNCIVYILAFPRIYAVVSKYSIWKYFSFNFTFLFLNKINNEVEEYDVYNK